MTHERLEKILFIPDVHSPYHDVRAFHLLEKVVSRTRPDTVVVGGDFCDFYAVSTHNKDPKRRETFEEEVTTTNHLLRRVEGWGFKKKLFICGNHENRLDRYIQETAPEMNGIVSVDKLLGLTAHGWAVTEYKDHTKLGRLYLTHDLGKSGANAVKDAMISYQDNVVINHIHRIIYLVEGNAKGVPHVAACFGWLGDVTKVDYMFRIKANRDWALGIGFGYLRSNGFIYLTPVPFVEYSCCIEGQLYQV
jgi:predicted phosphodiesterase